MSVLAKTHRTIQQWDHWLSQPLGQSILATEQQLLRPLLRDYYGKHTLLIGVPQQQSLLTISTTMHQVLLSPLLNPLLNNCHQNNHQNSHHIHYIESKLYELPIAPGSVDIVILPHILECVDNPHRLLTEACRSVKPEGHIIICGFNPYSLWGLKKLWMPPKTIPWSAHFIPPNKIKKWLALTDFIVVKQRMMLYRPPLNQQRLYHKLAFLEWLGNKLYAPFGGVYVLIGQAKVVPLIPIKLQWKQKFVGVPSPLVAK